MDVGQALDALGVRTQGLVTVRRLTAAGVSRQALALAVARGEVVRVRRGLCARTALPGLPEYLVTGTGVAAEWAAHVRSALLALGGDVTAWGTTAAALYGWGLLVEPGPVVDVAVRHGRSGTAAPGVRVTQRRAAGLAGVPSVAGCERLRVTSPVQTVLDGARTLPLLEAVVLCDSALRSGLVRMPELEAAAVRLRGLEGADRVREVLALSDELAGSVLERVLRVRLVQAGLCGTTQVPLHDRHGRPVLRADFCFAVQRLVIEVDGAAWHRDAARDRARDNALAAAGWRVLRFTWAEVVHGPDAALALVRAALTPDEAGGGLAA